VKVAGESGTRGELIGGDFLGYDRKGGVRK